MHGFIEARRQPTQTELRAHTRHAAFHAKIAEGAALLIAAGLVTAGRAPCPTCGAATPGGPHFPVGPMWKIKRAVCKHFGVSHGDLISARRQRYIVIPRQVAMFFCKDLTGASLPTIGRAFGGRDHTTVLHACRKIADWIANDTHPKVSQAVAEIRAEMEAPL